MAPEVEEIITAWREGDVPVEDWQNPAGPMFTGGEYAESEITMRLPGETRIPSSCSGSRAGRVYVQCC